MGETTDRLETIRARREAGDDPKMDRIFSRFNIFWGIFFTILTLMFMVGRNVMTKEEADRTFLRQDVYQRDFQHTTKQLETIEAKLDRVVEAVNARP